MLQKAQVAIIPRWEKCLKWSEGLKLFLTTENSIDGGEKTPLLPGGEPEAEEGDEAAAGAADHGVDNGPLDHVTVFVGGDLGVGGSVEGEEAKHEDESPQCGKRDRVAGNFSAGPVSIKSPNPRSKE